VTEQIQLQLLEFEAQSMIHQIAPTPLLMVVPGNDNTELTTSQSVAFEKARGPKKLVLLGKAGHFDIYQRKYFGRNISARLEFLKARLH
jgi:hypothetical protein